MNPITLDIFPGSNTIHHFRCRIYKFISISILLIICIYSGNKCVAQQRFLLALSKKDHTLAIVNPVTLKVLTRIPVGSDPHEVIASSDGKTAYVSIYGGGSLHELTIIDLLARKPLSNFDTRPLIGPHGLAFVGGKVWFTAEGSKSVGRFDPQSGLLDWSMGTGQDRTHMIYVTSDGKQVYTTNVSSGTVSILAEAAGPVPPGGKHTEWIQTVIPVSKGCEGFDVSPDGRKLWTVSALDGSISVIDISSRKVTGKIDARVQGANRLKFTPDGKRVLISSLKTGDLSIFDVASHKQIKRLRIGHGAAGILIDADGSRAFAACTPDNYVAVIDLKTLTVIAKIDIGGGPDGLAWGSRL